MPALITALPGVSALRTSDTAIPSLNLKHLRVIANSLIIPSDRLVLTGQNDACTPAEGDLPTQLRRGHNKQHRVLFAVCRMSDSLPFPDTCAQQHGQGRSRTLIAPRSRVVD